MAVFRNNRQELSAISNPPATSMILHEAEGQAGILIQALEQGTALLRRGETRDLNVYFAQVLNSLRSLVQVGQIAAAVLGVDLSRVPGPDGNLSKDFLIELERMLNEVTQAHQEGNVTLLADLLESKFLPAVIAWKGFLAHLRGGEEKRHSSLSERPPVFTAGSEVHPRHRFKPWQVWPGSYDNPPADGTYPRPADLGLAIDRTTPIASIGSCFAREIKNVLLREGFSYIIEERHHPASRHGSAAWERVYNTFSLRQIFAYTFEHWAPAQRWWQTPVTGRIQDPYRRVILYDSIAEAEQDFQKHRRCSYRALKQARVLILTLGLTEIWEDRVDGTVICIPSGPYVNEGGDLSRYRFRVSRYGENLDNLEHIHAIMAAHNPGCKLIVTVSPVHLWATFRQDCDVLSASCNSNATLRAVVDEFAARHDNVWYFPAFEMATIYRPLLNQPIFADGRENYHVNQATIEFIMQQFFNFYCRGRGTV